MNLQETNLSACQMGQHLLAEGPDGFVVNEMMG
jgi:hypothetical protein